MIPKVGDRGATGSYFELVQKFPLMVIRDDDQLDAAIAVLDELLRRELDEGQQAYLEVLENLIEAYEEKHVSIPDASESDVLRLLMDSKGISQTRLARESGVPQSTISNVLRGVRRLTRGQIETFAAFFHVDPGAFLPGPGARG